MMGVSGGRARWLVWRVTFAGALTLWLLAGLAPFLSVAHADGGAPNLSYIVGGGASADNLTIIDIGGRKIAATIPVGGEPRAVALSCGRALCLRHTVGAQRGRGGRREQPHRHGDDPDRREARRAAAGYDDHGGAAAGGE